MKFLYILPLLLLAGAARPPQWDSSEQTAAEKALENAGTQVEMTGATGALAISAEAKVAEALEYKLSTLPSRRERIELLQEQMQWQRQMGRRNAESMGDGSIARMEQLAREQNRLKQRFLELTAPEAVYRAFVAMRKAQVRFNGRKRSLFLGELDIDIPKEKQREDGPVYETVGELRIPFCRMISDGKDTWWIGVIEPTNYGVISSFGMGTESNLCIWKNGENIANHLIGKEIDIEELTVSDHAVKVIFRTKEGTRRMRLFNWRVANDDEVRINHWTTEKID